MDAVVGIQVSSLEWHFANSLFRAETYCKIRDISLFGGRESVFHFINCIFSE